MKTVNYRVEKRNGRSGNKILKILKNVRISVPSSRLSIPWRVRARETASV